MGRHQVDRTPPGETCGGADHDHLAGAEEGPLLPLDPCVADVREHGQPMPFAMAAWLDTPDGGIGVAPIVDDPRPERTAAGWTTRRDDHDAHLPDLVDEPCLLNRDVLRIEVAR